jgi:hypothetical protein
LFLSGSISLTPLTVTSDSNINQHSLIFADTTSSNLLLTLPDPSSATGRIVTIKEIDTSNDLTIYVDGGGNIDNSNHISLFSGTQLPMVKLLSSGDRWNLLSQMGNVSSYKMVFFEAESGTLGSNYQTLLNLSALSANLIAPRDSHGGNSPEDTTQIITYSIPLESGTYDLYARYLVGEDAFGDDSFLIGNGFGVKLPTVDADWITVNNLTDTANSYVSPENVETTNETFNWVKMSTQSTFSETVPTFTSTGGTETFMIAHRENGFLLDAFAFVSTGLNVSSASLSHQSTITSDSGTTILGVQAESGVLGANYAISANTSSLGGNMIITTSNQTGNSPDSFDDLATYSITLPQGYYNFYARFSVGPSGTNDDSFFAANSFGNKTLADADWVNYNSLTDSSNSYTDPEGAEITDQTFQWVNLSQQVSSVIYYSSGGIKSFEIAHRENGFELDAFAFVSINLNPSSADLNSAVGN